MTQQEKENMIETNRQFIVNCLSDYISGRKTLNRAMLRTPFKIVGVPDNLSLKEQISYFNLISEK